MPHPDNLRPLPRGFPKWNLDGKFPEEENPPFQNGPFRRWFISLIREQSSKLELIEKMFGEFYLDIVFTGDRILMLA